MSTTHGERPSLDCRETVRRLFDYLDRELSEAETAQVDAHLANCAECPPHFEFERRFLAAIREARRQEPASAALRARIEVILRT